MCLLKYAHSYTPRFNEAGITYTGITLSVSPSVERIVPALYLQQYSSDPFHICTSYQATSEGVSRVTPVSKLKNLKLWQFFFICNFDFVFFWLGIQYDSMVWVFMRRWGGSSERRRSSCSSFVCLCCVAVISSYKFTWSMLRQCSSGALLWSVCQWSTLNLWYKGHLSNKIVDHSDVVGASPVGAAPTTSSFFT